MARVQQWDGKAVEDHLRLLHGRRLSMLGADGQVTPPAKYAKAKEHHAARLRQVKAERRCSIVDKA